MFFHVATIIIIIVICFVIVKLIRFIMNSRSKSTREASASVLTAIKSLQTLLESVETAQNNFSQACLESWVDDETCQILPVLDSLKSHYRTIAQSHIRSLFKKLIQKEYNNRREGEHYRLDTSESYTYINKDVSVTSTSGTCDFSGSRELFTTQEQEENYCSSSSIEALLNSYVVAVSETGESRDNNDHPNISALSGGSENGADDSVTSSCSYSNFKRDLEASLCDTDTTVSNADLNPKTVSDSSSYDIFGLRKSLDELSEEALKEIESWIVKKEIVQEYKFKLIQIICSSEDIIHFTTENTYTVGKNSIWPEVIDRVFYSNNDTNEFSAEQQNNLKQYLVGLARKKDSSYFPRNIKNLVELHQRYCPSCRPLDSMLST